MLHSDWLSYYSAICYSPLVAKSAGFENQNNLTESRFAEVSDEYLSSLLDKSLPKSTKKATKYGMKVFNGTNAQSKFELLKNVTVILTPFATISIVFMPN